MEQIALSLIATGHIDIGYIHNKKTALIIACSNLMNTVAIALIQTNKSNPTYKNINSNALFISCYNKLIDVAMLLLTNQEVINSLSLIDNNVHKFTSLSVACYNGLEPVALAIIAINKTNFALPNYRNITALIFACSSNMEDVALKLIDTGNSNPSIIFNEQNDVTGTALIIACKKKMIHTALALIATGNSNLNYTPKSGENAMYWAKQNNLDDVVKILYLHQYEQIRVCDFIPINNIRTETDNLLILPNQNY